MSDRIRTLTVVLDADVRDDDCEPIINAIAMIKRVRSVTPHVSDIVLHTAIRTARLELQDKLWKVINEANDVL